MATIDTTGFTGKTEVSNSNFVPNLWLNEILVSRENNLVAGKLFRRINHQGKKGDTLNIPNLTGLTANAKTENAPVTVQKNAESMVSVNLDKHYEVSQLFEDLPMIQQQYQLRSAYTKKAGYALSKQIDSDLLGEWSNLTNMMTGAGGAYTADSSAGANLTRAGILEAIEVLDEADVPDDGRFLIINPDQKNVLLKIDELVLYQNIGRTTEYHKGKFGTIFGLDIYITNNLDVDTYSTPNKICICGHKDAIACAMQLDVRVQAQYMQDYLGTLVTSDVVYGVKTLRADHAVAMAVLNG